MPLPVILDVVVILASSAVFAYLTLPSTGVQLLHIFATCAGSLAILLSVLMVLIFGWRVLFSL